MVSYPKPDMMQGPHGPVAIFPSAKAWPRFGVRLIPTGNRPHMLIFDVDDWNFGLREEVRGLAPLLDRVIDFINAGEGPWDDPRYRELCALLYLNPDQGRPVFFPDTAKLGAALLAIVDSATFGDPSKTRSVLRSGFAWDVVDALRVGSAASPKEARRLIEEIPRQVPIDDPDHAVFQSASRALAALVARAEAETPVQEPYFWPRAAEAAREPSSFAIASDGASRSAFGKTLVAVSLLAFVPALYLGWHVMTDKDPDLRRPAIDARPAAVAAKR